MSKSVGRDLTKIGGALVLAGVLCWVFVPPASEVLTRPPAAATGPRTLIVVSTQGGASDHSLDVNLSGSIGGDLVVTTNLRTIDNARTDYEQVDLRITYFGPAKDGSITCQDEPAPLTRWDDLGEGAQTAFNTDNISTIAGAHPRGRVAADPVSESFPQWSGTISTVTKATNEDDKESAALTCTIPANWVWIAKPTRITALLPQINYNAINATTDFQKELNVTASIERDPAWVVAESYPEATVDAYLINQKLNQYWIGRIGEKYNLGYTTQPDLLFIARDTGQDDTKVLTLAGLALGIVGSLVVSALARMVDVAFHVTRVLRGSDDS